MKPDLGAKRDFNQHFFIVSFFAVIVWLLALLVVYEFFIFETLNPFDKAPKCYSINLSPK